MIIHYKLTPLLYLGSAINLMVDSNVVVVVVGVAGGDDVVGVAYDRGAYSSLDYSQYVEEDNLKEQ